MGNCLSRRHTAATRPPLQGAHASSSSSAAAAAVAVAASSGGRISIVTDLYNGLSNHYRNEDTASSPSTPTAATVNTISVAAAEPRNTSPYYVVDEENSGIFVRQEGDGSAHRGSPGVVTDAVDYGTRRDEIAETFATSESCTSASDSTIPSTGWSLTNLTILYSMLLTIFVAWLMMKLFV